MARAEAAHAAQSSDAACQRSVPHGRASHNVLPVLFYGAITAVLAGTGYPVWRVAAVAVAAVVQQVSLRGWPRRDIRRCVNADADQLAVIVVRAQTVFLVTTSLTVAVTGGVRSPLLVTILSAYLASVAAAGDRRPTRLLLGATALATSALALLPRAVTGPEVASSAYGVLTALSVLGLGALLAPVHARARSRREERARWRKELAADALARAGSLEQIGSKVAHELKNPLTSVKALVQLGLRNPAEVPSHGRLEILEQEVTRMQEILQNYLSFTRPLQTLAPRPVGLGSLVADTLGVLAARADDARVRLYAQGDATIDADPRRLKEALLNLVANAIEATPPGGEVTVGVRPAGGGAEIDIRDTGRGMAPETLRRVGTPFFTTRDDGTGLGVVLARSVIAQHGGTLTYESELARGTRARVSLPRVVTEMRDAACAARR